MLSETTQAVKDKYHMISPISGTLSVTQTHEQNRTRDTEVKNKLTMNRGEEGGDERVKKGKDQVKRHVQGTHGQGQ